MSDQGAVTAELAAALVGVLLVLSAVLGAGVVGIEQLRVTDAARAGARAAARGDDPARVREVARRAAGSAVTVSLVERDGFVEVRVVKPVTVGLAGAPVLRLEAVAVAAAEGQALARTGGGDRQPAGHGRAATGAGAVT